MKKSILFLIAVALISFSSFAQLDSLSLYKNLTVTQNIHVEDDSLTSCYIVITGVQNSYNLTQAQSIYVNVSVYKSKAKAKKNNRWTIPASEIPNGYNIQLTLPITATKVSEAVKAKLLSMNKTWISSNIIIE